LERKAKAQIRTVELLGSGEHADDDLVERQAGPEEEPALDGAAGHLDEGSSLRNEADRSPHTS
jgi:hypothetical protein